MRIVVSGTHASGKSTLVHDLAAQRPDLMVLPDPYELLDDAPDEPDAATFLAQLVLSADRLLQGPGPLIAERGPLDFVAYLEALERLGRPTRSSQLLERGRPPTAEAMRSVDLLVVLHAGDVAAPADEDPELRGAMADALLDLVDDGDLLGGVEVLELAGDPATRLAALLPVLEVPGLEVAAVDDPARRRVRRPEGD